MAILGSNIPVASFYFRSTEGFPKCCSKDSNPRFGDFDSSVPLPGPVQDLNITPELLDVMKTIAEVHRRGMRRTLKLFLLVVALILGCAISIGSIVSSDSREAGRLRDPKKLISGVSGVLGFFACMIAILVSVCCCVSVVCKTSSDLKHIIGDSNGRCEYGEQFPSDKQCSI